MTDKLILITGGSSGIGKAAAVELYKLGARIILQARDVQKLEQAAKEIGPTGERIACYSADLSDKNSVEESANLIVNKEGLPDVVINSAGAGEWLSFNESSPGHYEDTMGSPYLATAFTCKVFYDLMRDRGKGHFILINSAACYFAFPGATGYIPARWAMLGFSRSLQADLYNTDFKVSMIALGKVKSPYFENNPISEDRIPKVVDWLIPTLSVEASGKIISAVVKNKKSIVNRPRMISVMVLLNRLVPGLFRWVMRITGHK
ncbi:SDR family NAD(P)-dependent oxidoreductase [Lutimonas saemankumensis]|uniref:SDR family NAD(P)-dependent oxidoreductase n=1 Tax=Lutimonas saemankumensis TaxID=483016 RepID=UPI001CD6CD32|nr:SDR family NAD(P)-dependent oxidoreductase [Lutimonas saemankumensis]MCA0931431.1 SDR family NAD(P)-dependent oxidoreductase [Lutimonas saemankumensis]